MSTYPLLSLAIWIPILAGAVVLATGGIGRRHVAGVGQPRAQFGHLRGVERGESPDPVPPTNRTAASAVGCVSVRSIWRASWS